MFVVFLVRIINMKEKNDSWHACQLFSVSLITKHILMLFTALFLFADLLFNKEIRILILNSSYF